MPFTKGDPNINTQGRPVGSKNFTTKVRAALEKIAEGKDYTYEEAFVKSILKKAIVDGDASTQRMIWNYLDGLPVQRLGGEEAGKPIQVELSETIAKKNGITSNTE
jgi:uncharacterized protein YehS (DUF1456 family)